MAVILSLRPMVQPKWEARSPITAVTSPMPKMLITKVAYPIRKSGAVRDTLLGTGQHCLALGRVGGRRRAQGRGQDRTAVRLECNVRCLG